MSTPDPVKVGGFVFHPEPQWPGPIVITRSKPDLIPFPDPRTGKPQRVSQAEAHALVEMAFAQTDADE